MLSKHHNHILLNNPWNREEELYNTYHHKTSGSQLKQSNQISLSLPHQDDCKSRKDTKYSITKL